MPSGDIGQNGTRKPYNKADWRPFFLAELARTHCVKAALDKAQISRQTYQRYKAKHPDFAQACRDARESAVDHVEAVVHRRCLHGDKVKRFDREGAEYLQTVYPDTLIIRYLQAHRPEKWHRAPLAREAALPAGSAPPRVIMLSELEEAEQ